MTIILRKLGILLFCTTFASSCSIDMKETIVPHPPKAKKIPKELTVHGDTRVDNYYWLNNREDDKVIAYLEAENKYYNEMTSHTHKFQEELYNELKGRIKQDDESVPYKLNGYFYNSRFEKGKEYPIYFRQKGSLDAEEEILFDCNLMAKGHDFFNLRGISVSPNNKLATFGTDTVSRRQYDIQFKNLETNEIYPDKIENTTGSSVWAADNKTIFYTKKDPVTLRSDKIYKHQIGTPTSQDVLVFEEEDETFNVFVYMTKSKKYIVIGSVSTLTSEYRFIKADEPDAAFTVFSPRERGLEYSIYHFGDTFYILTNKDDATNFKLMQVAEKNTNIANWEEFIPHREAVLLEDIEIFEDYYVLSEREEGLNKLKIVRWDGTDAYYLPFDSETYVAGTYTNLDFETDKLRYFYNAMESPYAIVEMDMKTKAKTILKEQEVLGGKFNKQNYKAKRIWANARDGKKVPICLVYHKDTPINGTAPLLQYAYGSYGSTIDPYFSTQRLSLLDRGFIFAIAHIRGGEYLGRPWYDDGKLLKKKNTFTDFIDCSKYLIEQNYTSSQHLYAMGGSAGGLLMGAIINMEPNLYNGVVAQVPFVDVITTMLDDTIPLTTGEYDEWGNPNDKTYYEYMKSYSPYDNLTAKEYPNMYVSTGLHDSQVQYWEPAKWVAKLRDLKTDNKLLFLDTNMDAGHGGASGRFEALKETAKEYAFLLDLEGKIPSN